MGKPMVRNLMKEGYNVTIFDIVGEAVEEMVGEGATPASSAMEVASKNPVVITMVPDSPQSEAAILGPGGVLEGASAGLAAVGTHIRAGYNSPPRIQGRVKRSSELINLAELLPFAKAPTATSESDNRSCRRHQLPGEHVKLHGWWTDWQRQQPEHRSVQLPEQCTLLTGWRTAQSGGGPLDCRLRLLRQYTR